MTRSSKRGASMTMMMTARAAQLTASRPRYSTCWTSGTGSSPSGRCPCSLEPIDLENADPEFIDTFSSWLLGGHVLMVWTGFKSRKLPKELHGWS